ncbi:MAG: xanthine dehydrogenase family protein molybdopterin-binding subunit [Vicinamibacterales bacterium]
MANETAQQPPAVNPNEPTANAKKYAWALPPEKTALLSTSVERIDGPGKVSGTAKYTYDINRPGMLWARAVRSPHPHAKITDIDFSAAKKAPGVRAVLQWKDPGTEVMYQGDVVAAVAADSEDHARDAARLVKVTYETLPFAVREAASMDPATPKIFANGNTRAGNATEVGDLAAGFKAAAHVVEATYDTQVITHVCLETHGAVCEWTGDKLTAWVSTQGVHGVRTQLAGALKVPEANIRVICEYMGGGFGSKIAADAPIVIPARLALMTGTPVKMMLDRKEEHLDTGNRPSAFSKIRAGVAADGKLTAFDAQTWGTGGAGQGAQFPLPYIYQFPNRKRTHLDVYINAGNQRPMRAPGHPQGCFATEVLMDELADLVKMDPLEFRLKNLPPKAPDAMWGDYFTMGAKKFGWNKRHATGDGGKGHIKTGMGVSANQWGGGGRAGNAHIDILSDGSVVVKVGTQDIGTGTRTVVPMVAAETLGVPLATVRGEIGDTILPFAGASGGSTATAGVVPAIRIAAGRAREALLARVAPSMGVDASTLEIVAGRVQVKGGGKSLSWKAACKQLGQEPISIDNAWEPGLSSVNTSGVQFAEVTVDTETGIVKVDRVLAIQDCGLVVNKLLAESQVYGGVISSINFALFEDRILDRRTGQMVNPNMEHYLLAGISDVPKVEVMLMNMPERGIIGIGEPPTVPTASAIANAVRNATGATIRSLPLHPHRVLAALEAHKAGRKA